MVGSFRQAVGPIYLLACLILGGSAQGDWTNALLQLAGIAILAWAGIESAGDSLSRPARQLLLLLLAALAVVALQLVPLPAALWPELGGRSELAEGYRVLGVAVPARPLSLAPSQTLSTLFALIPPAALFCAVFLLGAFRASWLVAALVGAAIAGTALGVLQVSSPDPANSPWYLYRQSSVTKATGFFANVNNMTMLLVICLPFLAALLVSERRKAAQRYSALLAVSAGAVLTILIGIGLNRSLAGYGLLVPVLIASAILVIRPRRAIGRLLASAAIIGLLAVVAAFALSPTGSGALAPGDSVQTRMKIMSTSLEAAKHFMPLGSGLGTFRGVYRLFEDHDSITRTQAGHAHNDYLELVVELGVPGLILIVIFLIWWAAAVRRVWRYSNSSPYARAASIASAVLLAHSLVEFPLRTAALSACFAMCLALLLGPRAPASRGLTDLRPARHEELR